MRFRHNYDEESGNFLIEVLSDFGLEMGYLNQRWTDVDEMEEDMSLLGIERLS